MSIHQLPIKSPYFNDNYLLDIKELTIGDVVPKLKGSYKRKEMGDYITDIDNNSILTFSETTHTEIYQMLNNLRNNPNSKFLFMYLGCGWIKQYVPPWEIDDKGGCIFNLQEAIEWVYILEEKEMIPKESIDAIKAILVDKDRLIIKNLITIRNIVKEYGELKWNEEDIERGYIEYSSSHIPLERYNLVDLLKNYNGILEFIYAPAPQSGNNNDYISVTTSLMDHNYPIDKFKAFWPFYTSNYYDIIKSIKWKIHKDKLHGIYKKTMEITSPYVALKYQIENLQNMITYHPYMEDVINYMWFDIIIPAALRLGFYSESSLPSLTRENLKIFKDDLSDYIEDAILHNYPERLFLTFIKAPSDRKELEIKLMRMRESQIPVEKGEIDKRWSQGNLCPFFLISIDDLNKMADLAQRTYIELDKITNCFIELSKVDSRPMTEIINEVFEQNHLSINLPRGKGIIKLFYKKELIAEYPIEKKAYIQRFIILFRLRSAD